MYQRVKIGEDLLFETVTDCSLPQQFLKKLDIPSECIKLNENDTAFIMVKNKEKEIRLYSYNEVITFWR